MAKWKWKVEDVVCDYGVFEDGELKLILNSKSNALKIVEILEEDERKHRELNPLNFAEDCPFGKIRRVANAILDVFEDMLEEKGIKIPDEDRAGGEDEANIYGETYFALEDKIAGLLRSYIDE